MTNASVCEELPSKSVAVLECDAGSREPRCNPEYIRGSAGASGKTCVFLWFSNGFAHARFAGAPVPVGSKRIQNPKRSRSKWPHWICWVAGFARNACFYNVFERFLGNHCRRPAASAWGAWATYWFCLVLQGFSAFRQGAPRRFPWARHLLGNACKPLAFVMC